METKTLLLLLGLICIKHGFSQSQHVCIEADLCTTDSQCDKGRICKDYVDHKCCETKPPVHVCAPGDECSPDSPCGHGRTCVHYVDHYCCTTTKAKCAHSDMCSSNADCHGHGRRCKRGCCTRGHGGHK